MNRRGRIIFDLLITTAACALIAGAAVAQALTKPYQQWTARETERLLSDSPWAQTEPGLVRSGRTDPVTEVVDTTITVRLRSALPVREALARLNQLKDRYDQKNEHDRTVIDARNKELLECSDCADYYAVSITPGAGSRSDLPAFLSSGRTAFELIRQNVFLENDKHEKRELKKFTRPKSPAGEAIFFFSRLDSKGNSLVGPGSRTVIISFDPRVFDWKKATVTKFKFDLARMTINGQVAF